MEHLRPVLLKGGTPPKLITLIEKLLGATKDIAQLVSQGALAGVLGFSSEKNTHGERQKHMDVIANRLMKGCLLQHSQVRTIASEEEGTVVAGHERGHYVVAFDPLDGSSNIDSNGQIGTIFTIYPARGDVPANSELQFRRPGTQQVCAGYVLYGPSTLLVITTGGPTHCFTLDVASGEFLLATHQMHMPVDTQEFAVNMANQRFWDAPFRRYIDDLLNGEKGPRVKRYNMRWNAAMVGDVHRILTRGGIFIYPEDNRDLQQPAKLRLLYEANPIALLIEKAGGKAYTQTQRILAIEPFELHQRVAVIVGSANEVDACLGYFK